MRLLLRTDQYSLAMGNGGLWREVATSSGSAQQAADNYRASRGQLGYEAVADEPPEVTAISCMRCVNLFSMAGISVRSAVGSSAIA